MKPLIFKTTNAHGRNMIYKISFVVTMAIYGLIYFTIDTVKKQPEESIPYFIMAFLFFSIVYMLLKMPPRWFLDYFTVELYEDRLVGYNLFGKKGELIFSLIKEIRESEKIYDYGPLIVDEFNNYHRINGGMDYAGFVTDYVIEKCKSYAVIDYKFINKIKSNPYDWNYTRSMPFDTKYENGYLEWLEPIVNAQKEMLIQRGELRGDVLYGDDVKKLLWTKKER
jgi:hypothetical protein